MVSVFFIVAGDTDSVIHYYISDNIHTQITYFWLAKKKGCSFYVTRVQTCVTPVQITDEFWLAQKQ